MQGTDTGLQTVQPGSGQNDSILTYATVEQAESIYRELSTGPGKESFSLAGNTILFSPPAPQQATSR
ncbi:MAG: hypothetical protein HC824_15770 [Synechococcales cyanobacterium RM1_1_8]|nr:hypothetical protein [Synechococcales cyanobacterium RM1_1_8]